MIEKMSNPLGYQSLLRSLKDRIQQAQIRAALAVTRELVLLYWGIGKEILSRQREDGWGTKVIERLAKDLRSAFPEMQGLSPRNLGYLKAFAEAWPEESILQQLVAKLPWGHNVRLLDLVKSAEERLWYAGQALGNGWSRNVLVMQIESGAVSPPGESDYELPADPPSSAVGSRSADPQRSGQLRLPYSLNRHA
jgi:predicted nuclease of restriction endonuclease-like (RecB) superfamily